MSMKDHRSARELRNPRNLKGRAVHQAANPGCAPWTTLLPDAAEGLLNDAEQRALDYHLAGCAACSEELAEAQRGLAWLTVLKDEVPPPPADLLANILAQTSGMAETGVMLPPLAVAPAAGVVFGEDAGASAWERMMSGLRSWLLQPQLAMTAAMAFLSICLTLNLLGISIGQTDAQAFRNGGLQRTVASQRASLIRSIQGLRLVYRVESRVSEMRAQRDDPGDGKPLY